MATEKLPPNWDWVTARSKCSAPVMFDALRELARHDVERANEHNGQRRFVLQEPKNHPSHFSVIDFQNPQRREVHATFTLEGNTSIVMRCQDRALTATMTLNDEGQCKLKVDADELDPWQFMRRALEPLFFGA